MRSKITGVLFVCLCLTFLFTDCKGQKAFGTGYLVLQKIIPLPNVKGRIDHMAINSRKMTVYVAALGNNTLEVVDLKKGKDIHRINGLHEPQGVAYIPENHEVFVANGGNGDCYFYNARNYQKTAIVHLASDADDVTYDSLSQKIYVAYGEGGIAVIDADNQEKIRDYSLPAHPERFRLDSNSHQIYVNVPDAGQIDVIDLKQAKVVKRWENSLLSLPKFNFPMALDTVHNRLFVGYRLPARLVVLDSQNGKKITSLHIAGDPDDIYYNYQTGRIYVSSGGGSIGIFDRKGPGTYRKIANIPTRRGARTSLLVPELHLYFLAEPAIGNRQARLLVYRTRD